MCDNWKVEQRLIRVQMSTKTMTGEEIVCELVNILSVEYSISTERLLACMHDGASANGVAMGTIKVLLLFSHNWLCLWPQHWMSSSGYGLVFLHTTQEWISHEWISRMNFTRVIQWYSLMGPVGMQSSSLSVWWYTSFFTGSYTEYLPSTTKKLTQLITDTQKSACLQLELAVVIDAGEIFIKSTYALEGYEALVFKCYEVLCELYAFIQMAHFPNLVAVSRRLCHTTTQKNYWKLLTNDTIN